MKRYCYCRPSSGPPNRQGWLERSPVFSPTTIPNIGSVQQGENAVISKVVDAITSLEDLAFLATLVVGVGLLGYVGTAWLVHFSRAGQYFAAIAVAAVSLAVSALALVRVPLAQTFVLGGAIFCGTAFILGYGHTITP